MDILFAGFRPGFAFSLTGADVAIRNLMVHAERSDLKTGLFGAGTGYESWRRNRRFLRARLRRHDLTGEFYSDRLVYRSKTGDLGECVLFSNRGALLKGLVETLRAKRPRSVITTQTGAIAVAELCIQTGTRVALYVTEFESPIAKGNVAFFSQHRLPVYGTSQHVQRRIWRKYRYDSSLLYPKIDYRYRVADPLPEGRRFITILNASAAKGIVTFLEVAAMMGDMRFLVVDGWGSWDKIPEPVAKAIRALPNVQLLPSQDDVRPVLARTEMLLVPSIWEEAFGMVAPEAQANAIPVIASYRAGLPEAVGHGGILIRHFRSARRWVSAIRRLQSDSQLRDQIIARGLENAERFSILKPDPELWNSLLE